MPGAQADVAVRRAGRSNGLLGMDVDDDHGMPADVLCAPSDRHPAAIGGGADGPMADLVDAVGGWLGTAELRVTASMVVLGYSARLVGPSVAVLLGEAILLDLRPSQVRCSYVAARGFRLTLRQPAGWRGTPSALRVRWCRDLVDDHLGCLVASVRAVVPVAAGLLWGNVASGLAGALRALATSGAVPVARCHDAGLSMLDYGPLHNAGRLWVDGGQLRFLRRSCCLFYRLDGGGMCSDCPLPSRVGAA